MVRPHHEPRNRNASETAAQMRALTVMPGGFTAPVAEISPNRDGPGANKGQRMFSSIRIPASAIKAPITREAVPPPIW